MRNGLKATDSFIGAGRARSVQSPLTNTPTLSGKVTLGAGKPQGPLTGDHSLQSVPLKRKGVGEVVTKTEGQAAASLRYTLTMHRLRTGSDGCPMQNLSIVATSY